jgi:hypothetical protein
MWSTEPLGSIIPAPGSTFPCSGTVVHLAAPNDLTSGSWTAHPNVSTSVNTQTDPFGVTNNAGGMIANQTGTDYCFVKQTITVSAGITYSITGYLKAVSGPSWIVIRFADNVTSIGAYFDVSGTGTVGINQGSSCAQIQAAGNGFVQFSIAGSFPSLNGTQEFQMFMTDSNGGAYNGALNNQTMYYYTIGP